MSAALFPGHDRVIDTTSAHHMEWTLGEYQVEAKVVCTSGADANCRLVGDCECESYNIQRDLDGAAYHLVEEYDYDKDATEQVRHPMRQNESCNVADWINADDQIIKPMVKSTAARYAAEKKLSPRTPADCQS